MLRERLPLKDTEVLLVALGVHVRVGIMVAEGDMEWLGVTLLLPLRLEVRDLLGVLLQLKVGLLLAEPLRLRLGVRDQVLDTEPELV